MPNKGVREEIAGIEAELTHRANRIGGGYQPIENIEEEEEPEAPEEGEVEHDQNIMDTEDDSVIMRGENLPTLDLSKYHTEEKKSTIYNLLVYSHSGQTNGEQKTNRRQHKESWIQFYVGLENSYIKNGSRSGDD